MSTAIHRDRTSVRRRLCTFAVVGSIVAGSFLSGSSAVFADTSASQATSTPSTGFSVKVDTVQELTGLTAVVSSGGDGVNLRANASHDSQILQKLKDGTIVNLRIDTVDTVLDADGVTRWWPVAIGNTDGWISGFYLSSPDQSASETVSSASSGTGTPEAPTATPTPFDYTGEIVAGIKAKIDGDGDSVNLRSDASASSAVVTELKDGTTVTLRIDTMDTVTDGSGARWWPVTVNGKNGWVNGEFLRAADANTFAPGSYASVKTQSGKGIVVRADPKPDGDKLGEWNEGAIVQVMNGPLSFDSSDSGWYKVTSGDLTGYVDGDLLVPASQPAPASTATATSEAPAFAPGDRAKTKTQTGEGVRIRKSGDPSAAQTGFVPEGDVLTIVSGPVSHTNSTNGWYEITFEGTDGFVDGDLLVKTTANATTPTPSATATTTTTATATASATSTAKNGAAGNFRKGDYVSIDTQSNAGVNVREAPDKSSSVTSFLAENATVQVIDGPVKDGSGQVWYKVTNGGDARGWVDGSLVVAAQGVAPTETTSNDDTSGSNPTTTPTAAPASQKTPAPTATATSGASGSTAGESSQGFIYPLDSFTETQGFGCTDVTLEPIDPTLGCNFHDGIDLATTAGTQIHAAKAGTIVAAGWCDCGLGYYVEIDHGGGIHTLYGHMLQQPSVSVGQQVNQGDVIGLVGSTGLSTGPHTHFMVTVNGTAEDPHTFLP